jgi:hypothetical protein
VTINREMLVTINREMLVTINREMLVIINREMLVEEDHDLQGEIYRARFVGRKLYCNSIIFSRRLFSQFLNSRRNYRHNVYESKNKGF